MIPRLKCCDHPCGNCKTDCTVCDPINTTCRLAASYAECGNFTATFTGTIGASGHQYGGAVQWGNEVPGQVDPDPCFPGSSCYYFDNNYFWEFDVDLSIVFDPTQALSEARPQWHLSDGFVEFQPDGVDCTCGENCWYIKKLGETTATCCDRGGGHPTCETMEAPDFTVGIYVVSQDWETEPMADLSCSTTIDTDPINAFSVSHDGTTGSPTDVLLNAGGSGVQISFTGGDYDGYSCIIPVRNDAPFPVACINAIGKGISATALTSDVIGGSGNVGGGGVGLECNALNGVTDQSILGSSHTVTYNDVDGTFKWSLTLRIIAIPDMASEYSYHEDAASGTCGVGTLPIISEPDTWVMHFLADGTGITSCRCDVGVIDKSVCPQNQTYTLDTSAPAHFTCENSECQDPSSCGPWNIYDQAVSVS